MSSSPREDVHTRVTARIVADLDQGTRPWLRPWSAGHAEGRISRPLRANGQPYRGVNVLLLWGEAMARGYAAPVWMTYRQAAELGGQVRRGEHGALVVYANRLTRTETDDEGEEQERAIAFMKGYTVFNVAQIDGLPQRYCALPPVPAEPLPRLEAAERFFSATSADIRHGGHRAFYAPGPDFIQMPPFEAFRDAESHAATLAHELVHNAAFGVMPHRTPRAPAFLDCPTRMRGIIRALRGRRAACRQGDIAQDLRPGP